MTYQDAIKRLKVCGNECLDCLSCKEHDDAVEIAIIAMEKQIPKKPVEYNLGGVAPFMFGTGKCPTCDEGCNSDMMYCDKCGQKLRWFND